MLPPWWLALLLPLLTLWPQTATCMVQLQPVTRLAGWQANGSWVLNGPRTIAAGIAVNSKRLHVLQHNMGTWLVADVLAPPEPGVAEFVPGSVVLSTDGRLLAVAAAPTGQPPGSAASSQMIAGYVYKVVADSHPQKAFRYQLAGRLTLPVDPHTSYSSSSSSSSSSWSHDSRVATHVDMSADGQVVMACWAYSDNQATAAGQSGGPIGGAAVFSWKGFGLQALQLPLPQGSQSFGQSCKLSSNGHTALVLDGSRGAMVYSRELSTARGATAAFRATGWLAGAPAQQHYQVLAAALSLDGSMAALLVQGVQGLRSAGGAAEGSHTTLRVFAADGFRRWGEVCSIQLGTAGVKTGTVKLASFQGGVHVWTALDGTQHMYAVGVGGAKGTHCPTQPVLQTVSAGTAGSSTSSSNLSGLTVQSAIQSALRAAGAVRSPAVGNVRTIRAGKLKVDRPEAVFVAAE